MIALMMDPDLSRDELLYALTHDVGEAVVGDVPKPAKTAADQLDEAEMRDRMLDGIVRNTGTHCDVVGLADRLDVYVFAAMHGGLDASWDGAVDDLLRTACILETLPRARMADGYEVPTPGPAQGAIAVIDALLDLAHPESDPQRHGKARHGSKAVPAGGRLGGWGARRALSGALSKIARRGREGGAS